MLLDSGKNSEFLRYRNCAKKTNADRLRLERVTQRKTISLPIAGALKKEPKGCKSRRVCEMLRKSTARANCMFTLTMGGGVRVGRGEVKRSVK